jgi:hypothetical protein
MSGSGQITDGVPNDGDDGLDLGPLAGLIGISAGGYTLLDDPIAFIEFVVLDLLQQTALDVSSEIGARLIQINDILLDSTVGVLGSVVGDSIGFVGDSILDLIDLIDGIAQSLAAGAGPLGIILIPLVWAGAILSIGATLVGIWGLYLTVRSAIV